MLVPVCSPTWRSRERRSSSPSSPAGAVGPVSSSSWVATGTLTLTVRSLLLLGLSLALPGSPRSTATPSSPTPLGELNESPDGAAEDRHEDEGAEALFFAKQQDTRSTRAEREQKLRPMIMVPSYANAEKCSANPFCNGSFVAFW